MRNNKPKFVSVYKDLELLNYETDHFSELIWILSKLKINDCKDNNLNVIRDRGVVIPNWSPFNQVLSTNELPVSTVILSCHTLFANIV